MPMRAHRCDRHVSRSAMIESKMNMARTIDIPLDALTARRSTSPTVRGDGPARKPDSHGWTFYIETFGCQMNVHDSEKVAGLLLQRGYQQVGTPEAATLVLYNTC